MHISENHADPSANATQIRENQTQLRSGHLDGELGLRTGATTVSTIGVTRELNSLCCWDFQDLLELAANVHQNLLALLWRTALATSNISISPAGNALANCAGPDTDTVEAFSYIDDDSHKLSIILILKSLADGR